MNEAVAHFKTGLVTVSSTVPTQVPDPTIKPSLGIWLKTSNGNTGIIYIGDNNVASGTGYPLNKNESIFLQICNLKSLFFLAGTNNDTIAFIIL